MGSSGLFAYLGNSVYIYIYIVPGSEHFLLLSAALVAIPEEQHSGRAFGQEPAALKCLTDSLSVGPCHVVGRDYW